RQYVLRHLQNTAAFGALETIDAYYRAVIHGFLQTREKIILSEQERIRSALQRTLGRYTVQMEVAAGVASAATSILDLGTLLKTSADLIRERFDLYYVGLFLVDETGQWAVLRAGTGPAGEEMLRSGHQLDILGNSMIATCISRGEPHVALDVGQEAARFENPLLPDTHSEAAIPLKARGQVVGALTVQSQHVGAFSDLDVTVFRILADQLASAIANARLFAELRRSEEKYRTIIENIEEGYYEMDRAGNFDFVNDALCHILGYDKNEILGINYHQFASPEDVERLSWALERVYRLEAPAQGIEFRIQHKSEPGRIVELSASLVRDATGRPAGLRGIIRDATARKRAEQMLIERKALERSNKELEQFAYVASHDLQEPLRKIQAFADRLRTKVGPALGEEGRDYLERMMGSTRRMQDLINDLLSLSRVSTKGQPFVPVTLGEVAHEVISDLEALIEQTGGRVEVGELPTVEADPLQMRQLLQNLIGNGLKFHQSGEKPVITVSGQLVRIARGIPRQGADWCQILVTDNGIGFDEKYLDRIFQPFQRLHGRGEFEGTGIGLSVCLRIAERHGGSITARSQPGQGAAFIVTLPAHQMKEDGEA
ncbi:MAG TPA: ATP-binding protein, partial [Candidatus Acidoferrales bacterium]